MSCSFSHSSNHRVSTASGIVQRFGFMMVINQPNSQTQFPASKLRACMQEDDAKLDDCFLHGSVCIYGVPAAEDVAS